MSDSEAKIIEAISRRQYKDREFEIVRRIPNFSDGELAVIDAKKGGEVLFEHYVYVDRSGDVKATFLTMDELVAWVNGKTSRVENPFSFERMSAMIAILITITICTIVIVNLMRSSTTSIQVPEILGNGFTLILGFYFGSQVHKARPGSIENTNPREE